MGNHDQSRIATRLGSAQARVAAVLLLTLRGTPTLYYGDELGMPDARIAPDQVQDPAERNQPGLGLGRDPERSPMLWENSENAGFTSAGVRTWLPLVWDWPGFTVETETADSGTMLKLYRRLLQRRRELPALHSGNMSEVSANDGVLNYVRAAPGQKLRVLLNLTHEPRTLNLNPATIILSSALDRDGETCDGPTPLRGGEALLVSE